MSSKQRKRIVFGVFTIALLASASYLTFKDFHSSHQRRSLAQSPQGNGSAGNLKKERKGEYPSVDASNQKLSVGENKIKAKLSSTSDTKKIASSAINTSATADNATSFNFTSISLHNNTDTASNTAKTSAITTTNAPSNAMIAHMSSIATAAAIIGTSVQSISTTTSSSMTNTLDPGTTTSLPPTGQLLNQTTLNSVNGTVAGTSNGTLSNHIPGKGGLSPTLAVVVGLGCALVFFAIIYVVFNLVKTFKTFRFRRLHEMPMDDFDDYSGVYVEHTVPIRG